MENIKKKKRRELETFTLPNGEVIPMNNFDPKNPDAHWKNIYAKYLMENCVNGFLPEKES